MGEGAPSLWAASALTRVLLSGMVTGRQVLLHSFVDPVSIEARSDTGVSAFGAGSNAKTFVYVRGTADVILDTTADIEGQVATQLIAEYLNWNVTSHAHARCSCFGGASNADATIDATTLAKVTGRSGSLIRTADLTVAVNQQNGTFNRDYSRSRGFLDFGDANGHGSTALTRQIFWEVRVIMLGEPNPILEVDSAGNITKIVNVRVCDDNGHCYEDNPFTDTHTSGQLTGTTFTVDDIIYDHGARARFLANDLSGSAALTAAPPAA